MQENQISFKGINLTPYSDTSPDGQLAVCSMLEQRAGGLRPTVISSLREELPTELESLKLAYLHATSNYTHFIFSSSQGLYYGVEGSLSQLTKIPGTDNIDIKNISSVGNTLIVLSSEGLQYFLYVDEEYRYIGNKPSELNISFGLEAEPQSLGGEEVEIEIISGPDGATIVDSETVSDKIWSFLNSYFEGAAPFHSPFFIRAAYRLYKDAHYMATPPVLIIPDSKGPRALLTLPEIHTSGNYSAMRGILSSYAVSGKPTIRIVSVGNLEDWKDIIQGVDIFISPMIHPYEVGGRIYRMGFVDAGTLNIFSMFENSFGIYSSNSNFGYSEKSLPEISGTYFYMPWKKEEEFLSDIEDASQFYKVASYTVEEYVKKAALPVHERLNIKAEVLQNLTLQESLKDSNDYQSHDTIIADGSFTYNRRLHLFGLTRRMFQGFTPESMWPYTDDGNTQYTVVVRISLPDGTVGTVKVASGLSVLSAVSRFFYYPDANATRMMVYNEEGEAVLDIPLKPHPFLNGAYHLYLNTRPSASDSTPDLPEVVEDVVSMGNKLYVSEAENPFRFPLESIYTIGAGSILGLSTVATALSPGQFGQFPLMAFCTDGNYSLPVGEEGKYGVIPPPMSRDVCVNPSSITQTDSEVLFVTSKGVMVTSGASAQLLSADLDGVPDSFSVDLTGQEQPIDFFKKSLITYDYANRRFLFLAPGNSMAYIYQIETATWSTAVMNSVQSVLNSYPYSYIQQNNQIIKLNQTYPYRGERVEGTIITRPVKFDTLQQKVLYQIALQGIFSVPPTIKVYGSNDGIVWHCIGCANSYRIGRMAGYPYKYFRFEVNAEIQPDEHITGLRVVYDIRKNRRIR